MHGIDVSNWQKGLQLPESLDFCIVKATEGFRYVDPYCDGFIQQAIRKGILFGFYHFARNNEPEKEAVFFRDNTRGYELAGIPVLDIEDENIKDNDTNENKWGEYAQRFVDKYHAITGVYPVIYCSALHLQRFSGYPLCDTCGLWVAGYPDNRERSLTDIPKFCYDVSPWKFAAIWQYTSNGWLGNWDAPVDMDVAYMDAGAWKLYANPNAADIGNTVQMPTAVPVPDDSSKEFHFENSVIEVDVRLK